MCELLGMSSTQPVALATMLSAFARRGGEAADNPDGWGIYYRRLDESALEKAPEAGASSPRLAQLARSLQAEMFIAHVRKANPPTALTLENTHPFMRHCCGQQWVFAHNGKVEAAMEADSFCRTEGCQADGVTDSELIFCYLLQEIARAFPDNTTATGTEWFAALAAASRLVAAHGQFNFLLTDGHLLVAHAHDRLHGTTLSLDGSTMTVVASEPLPFATGWRPLGPHRLLILRQGETLASLATAPNAPRA